MPIIINVNDFTDNNQVKEFDSSFNSFVKEYLTDVTFTDITKHIHSNLETSNVGDQILLPSVDRFNSLTLPKDFDIIVSIECLKIYSTDSQRLLFYNINIDYQPLRCEKYGFYFMNVLMNLQEGLNSEDETQTYFGLKYADQKYFYLDDPVQCIIQPTPSAKKVNQARANYIRQSIDFVFMVNLHKNIQLCGA